jgi:hypothetical protein
MVYFDLCYTLFDQPIFGILFEHLFLSMNKQFSFVTLMVYICVDMNSDFVSLCVARHTVRISSNWVSWWCSTQSYTKITEGHS